MKPRARRKATLKKRTGPWSHCFTPISCGLWPAATQLASLAQQNKRRATGAVPGQAKAIMARLGNGDESIMSGEEIPEKVRIMRQNCMSEVQDFPKRRLSLVLRAIEIEGKKPGFGGGLGMSTLFGSKETGEYHLFGSHHR